MEASIGIHYYVILSIPVAICSLMLIVFVTIFCISHHKKDCGESRETLDLPAISTRCQIQPSSTETRTNQNGSNDANHDNASDKSSTSTNVKVAHNALKDKVCSQLQDGSTQSVAGHRNSGKGTTVYQSAEKVKSKGVASNVPALNTHGDQYLTSNEVIGKAKCFPDTDESQRLLKDQSGPTHEIISELQEPISNVIVTSSDSERSASVSDSLNSDGTNVSDDSDKSYITTKRVSSGQDGEPACHQVQPNICSKQCGSNNINSSGQTTTSINAKVIPNDKACSDSTGAGHRNSDKEMAIDQAEEKIKSEDVISSKPAPTNHDLTSNDTQEVIKKVWKARAKWYHIGIELGISADDLDAIQSEANHDTGKCFTQMLVQWLRKTGATWEALASALQSEPVGHAQLAESIIVPTSSAASYETTVDDSTSEGVMAFNCGCPTPCNLIDHLNGKCPNSLKLFPYLDSSKLTKKEQFDLEVKLRKDTTAIVTEFAKLTTHMTKSLDSREVKPKEVLCSVLGIAPSKSSTCPLLETLDVNSVTSVYDIIIHLQKKSYISFFNYDIVEFLINEYGTDEDKAELAEYIRHFQDFCQRSVFEIPQRVHGHPPKESTQLAIKVVPKCQWSRFSLGDAKEVQIKIVEELNLQNCAILPLVNISQGCIRLTFALPKDIMELVKSKLGPDSALSNINHGTEKYSIHIECGPPGIPFATNITSDSVSLQWTKPEYQGTLSLTHYVVYHRIHTSRWDKKKFTLTSGLQESVTVKGLSHEDGTASFVFKVEAVSKLGVTVESKESDPIQLSTPLSELKFRLNLDWKKKAAMPFGIPFYPQVALLKKKVYMGGGNTSSDMERHTVLVYDPQNDAYDTLPQYTHKYFAIAVVDNKLALIGGEQDDKRKPRFTNQLGVWDSRSLKWTHPLPPMSTPCKSPSVTTYKNKWVVVIGGYNNPHGALSRVEILDMSTQQWFNSAPMLAPCHQVSLATVGNMCYLVGGLVDNTTFSKRVYAANMDCLVSQTSATLSTQSPWSTLPDTPGTHATTIALNGALLAVGGMGADIYVYRSSIKRWENIGRLRIGRLACACIVLYSGEVLIAGGGEMKVAGDTGTMDHSYKTDQKVDIGTLK